jgi:hypothetical protein
MDLSRLALLANTSIEDLKNVSKVEELIIKLGFNDEILIEQPQIVKNNVGGLKIWQYPNQFSKSLVYLHSLNPTSYCEIGSRWGGTFALTVEYLRKLGSLERAVAIDAFIETTEEYCKQTTKCTFIKDFSNSDSIKKFMQSNTFDCVLIDGDHSDPVLSGDYALVKLTTRIIVFHDITNAQCPDVAALWNKLKVEEAEQFIFTEFIEQYPEVVEATGNTYLGIGVMVRKTLS